MRTLILGCGFTGIRVARSLQALGHEVIVTTRSLEKWSRTGFAALAVDVNAPLDLGSLEAHINRSTNLLYSAPIVPATDTMKRIVARARRAVFLSTTGVYGMQTDVDECAHPEPRTPRELTRFRAEEVFSALPGTLILRPAAIYGPHRGIHAAMRERTYRLSNDGSNYVSRIHVDDLVTHCVAGLESDLAGAWPVADDHPSTSREIAEFCADLLHIPFPESVNIGDLSETRRSNRRVDGSAIRKLLKIPLRYPSYRVGVPACIAEEALARNF